MRVCLLQIYILHSLYAVNGKVVKVIPQEKKVTDAFF